MNLKKHKKPNLAYGERWCSLHGKVIAFHGECSKCAVAKATGGNIDFIGITFIHEFSPMIALKDGKFEVSNEQLGLSAVSEVSVSEALRELYKMILSELVKRVNDQEMEKP